MSLYNALFGSVIPRCNEYAEQILTDLFETITKQLKELQFSIIVNL